MQNNVTWFHYNRKQATEKQVEKTSEGICVEQNIVALSFHQLHSKKDKLQLDTPFIHINKMTTAQQMSALY